MTFLASLVFSIFTSVMFFIKGRFFEGAGSTDLLTYFASVPYICILVIPAICAKKSRQIYDDFIPATPLKKLLKNALKCYLKYLIMIILMLPVCLFITRTGDIDYGQLAAGFFCLLLYGASLISLCLFINELFQNKTLAFVISALLLAAFNSIHLIPLYLNVPSFITSLCQNLSFAWHFDAASKGILDTRDILFLLFCTILFLYSAFFVQEIKKGRLYNKKEKAFYTGIFCLIFLLIFNSSSYYKRFDFSKNKSYSISSYTKKLCTELDDALNITYYRSSSFAKIYPQIRDITDYLNTYCSYSKNISFKIKDPDKDEAVRTMLDNYGITSQQLQNSGANSTQFTNVYSAIVMEYKGMVQVIPFIMASQSLEYDLDIRLRNLITQKNLTVNIIIGNGLSLNEDYGFIVPWLNSQGILANPLYIEDPLFVQNLNQSTGPLLVIGDSEINIENAIAIEDYILNQKGNAVFAVAPYSTTIDEDWSITANRRTNIVEMLENWGVTFTDKICADISCARITMYSDEALQDNPFTQTTASREILNYPFWINLFPQQYCRLGMTLFWPVKLELSQNAVPYLITSQAAWFYQTDRTSPSRLIETNPFLIQNETGKNQEKGTQIIGAQITGPLKGLYNLSSCPDSNLIVIPDQYFLNTLMTGYIGGDFGDYRNFEFVANCILKLNGEEELALLQAKTTRDSSLYKISDHTQLLKLQLLSYLLIFIFLPLAHLAVFLISRHLQKRYQTLAIKTNKTEKK